MKTKQHAKSNKATFERAAAAAEKRVTTVSPQCLFRRSTKRVEAKRLCACVREKEHYFFFSSLSEFANGFRSSTKEGGLC